MLNELSFAEAAAAIERGDITSEQLGPRLPRSD